MSDRDQNARRILAMRPGGAAGMTDAPEQPPITRGWSIDISGGTVMLFQDGRRVGSYPLKFSRRGRICLRHEGEWLIFERRKP